MPIPRILHQIWIGPKPAPTHLMDTWRDMNPDFEYIRWSESELQARGFVSECQSQIDAMSEINGKADIYRWEILHKYGGIFVDADSVCVSPFDDTFLARTAFAGFENETIRKGLVATGTMGFVPGYPLCRKAIDQIRDSPIDTTKRAWYTVGPGLLTRLLAVGKYRDFTVYPSFYFIPVHFTGMAYVGHKRVYAHQIWGNTKSLYDKPVPLPLELPSEPTRWVSMLIPSYNTKREYIRECLESIRSQNGAFQIELVWINDGSSTEATVELEQELVRFQRTSRFVKVKYIRRDENYGISRSLRQGICECSWDLVFRMDSDDAMLPDRMKRQLEFMDANPDCVVCGTDIETFDGITRTNHPSVIRSTDPDPKPEWFMNHPTLCLKRSAVLAVGNYGEIENGHEDRDLEIKLLEKHDAVYNIPECLVKYRLRET